MGKNTAAARLRRADNGVEAHQGASMGPPGTMGACEALLGQVFLGRLFWNIGTGAAPAAALRDATTESQGCLGHDDPDPCHNGMSGSSLEHPYSDEGRYFSRKPSIPIGYSTPCKAP